MNYKSHIFRALVAVIVGILLIEFKNDTVKWITVAIGILFFISGIISVVTYYVGMRRYKETTALVYDSEGNQLTGIRPSFPIVGIGSVILGGILALMPETFVSGLVYIFAALLILGAVNQFSNLVNARAYARIGWYYWIMPSLILLVGIIAIIRPDIIATAPLVVLGWCMILYGIIEMVNTIKASRVRKAYEKAHPVSSPDPQYTDTGSESPSHSPHPEE